jgi:GT2 family glycosyltransferase
MAELDSRQRALAMPMEASSVMDRKQAFFSVVIPTHNRPEQLLDCLEGLARLDYPRESFEVIVVVDGSGKPHEKALTHLHETLDLTIMEQKHAGPASARNAGAAVATGRFLSFIDDDCIPAVDWLRRLANRLHVSPDCAVGGRTVNALRENIYATTSQLLVDYLYAYYNADPDQSQFFASNNMALPADRFRLIGGFNTQYRLAAAEDRDLCRRWSQHGYGMIYEPEAIVFHTHALTFCRFWRQHFHYGFGAFHFHRLHHEKQRGYILPEPTLFYVNLVQSTLRTARKKQSLLLTPLLFVSQTATALGFLWAWMQGKND